MHNPSPNNNNNNNNNIQTSCVRCNKLLLFGENANGWHQRINEHQGPFCPSCSDAIEKEILRGSRRELFKPTKREQKQLFLQSFFFPMSLIWVYYLPYLYDYWYPLFVFSVCSGGLLLFHIKNPEFRQRTLGFPNPTRFSHCPYEFGKAICCLLFGLGQCWYQYGHTKSNDAFPAVAEATIVVAIAMVCLWKTSTSDPGRPSSHHHSSNNNNSSISSSSSNSCSNSSSAESKHKNWCEHCRLITPARGQHCYSCESCVSEFDIHSLVVNNCIGSKNRRMYMATCAIVAFAYLQLLKVSMIYIQQSGSSFQLSYFVTTLAFFWDFPVAVVCFYWNITCLVSFCFLWWSILEAACSNATMDELSHWQRYEHMTHKDREGNVKFRNSRDLGFCSNLYLFFRANNNSSSSSNNNNAAELDMI